MSFEFQRSALTIPPDIPRLFEQTWADLANPGSGWTAPEKMMLVSSARDARANGSRPTGLPGGDVTTRLVDRLVNDPAGANRDWVRKTIDALGVVKYVEAVGWGSIVIAVDTFHQLVGLPLPELPEPVPGEAQPVAKVPGLKMRTAWVPMTGLPLPRLSTSAVPTTQVAANRLLDRLYKLPDQGRDVDHIRGLTPPQMELIVSTVSHSNRCFYCTLGHLHMLISASAHAGLSIDTRGIVDTSIDTAIPGSRQLIELSRSASTSEPDPSTLTDVAETLGEAAAVTAAEVASCFQMINRLVEMTGQPAMEKQRERMMPVIEPLGLLEFPHSGLTVAQQKPSLTKRVARKLRS